MNTKHQRIKSQRGLELTFFVLYFMFVGLMPILENAQQFISQGTFYATTWYFLISRLLNIFPFWFYYSKIIPTFLFKKKYLQFSMILFLFLGVYELYLRIVTKPLLTHFPFLPKGVQKLAVSFEASNSNIWIVQHISTSIVYLLGITALAYFIRYSIHKRELDELKADQLQLELDYLKAQINPHFFFNTLNNIYSLALDRSPATAPVVLHLSEMMEYVLNDSGRSKVTLREEIDFICNYVNTEKIRFSDHISINLKQEGETTALFIAPLLLLPFIENAFKHGVREEPESGYVNISIHISERKIILNVKNSITKTKMAQQSGLGLQNVQKRLSLLYPNKHKLWLDQKEDTYEVTLKLNLD